jgi:hypothetical protein
MICFAIEQKNDKTTPVKYIFLNGNFQFNSYQTYDEYCLELNYEGINQPLAYRKTLETIHNILATIIDYIRDGNVIIQIGENSISGSSLK